MDKNDHFSSRRQELFFLLDKQAQFDGTGEWQNAYPLLRENPAGAKESTGHGEIFRLK